MGRAQRACQSYAGRVARIGNTLCRTGTYRAEHAPCSRRADGWMSGLLGLEPKTLVPASFSAC